MSILECIHLYFKQNTAFNIHVLFNVIFSKTRMWSAIQNSNPTFEWEFPIHLNPPNTCSSNTASSQVDFSLNLLFQVDFGLDLLFPPDHLERVSRWAPWSGILHTKPPYGDICHRMEARYENFSYLSPKNPFRWWRSDRFYHRGLVGTIRSWCKNIYLRWMIRLLFRHWDIFFCRNAVLYLTNIIKLPDYVNKH